MSTRWRILAAHEPHYYILCDRPIDGVTRWFCLQPYQGQQGGLRAALNDSNFDCSIYGDILASGTGESPPSHIIWELNKQFKC